MITLKNLVKDGNLIRTDYIGHDNKTGHIVYDIAADNVVEKTYSESENDETHHSFAKAIVAIKKLIEFNQFPSTYRYVWF